MKEETKAVTEEQAAQYIARSRSFLRQGRMNGDREGRTPTPPYLKIGSLSVRYLIEDLDRRILDEQDEMQRRLR